MYFSYIARAPWDCHIHYMWETHKYFAICTNLFEDELKYHNICWGWIFARLWQYMFLFSSLGGFNTSRGWRAPPPPRPLKKWDFKPKFVRFWYISIYISPPSEATSHIYIYIYYIWPPPPPGCLFVEADGLSESKGHKNTANAGDEDVHLNVSSIVIVHGVCVWWEDRNCRLYVGYSPKSISSVAPNPSPALHASTATSIEFRVQWFNRFVTYWERQQFRDLDCVAFEKGWWVPWLCYRQFGNELFMSALPWPAIRSNRNPNSPLMIFLDFA